MGNNLYNENIIALSQKIVNNIGVIKFKSAHLHLALNMSKALQERQNQYPECKRYMLLIEKLFIQVDKDGIDFDPYGDEYKRLMDETFWVVSKYLKDKHGFLLSSGFLKAIVWIGIFFFLLLYFFDIFDNFVLSISICFFFAIVISIYYYYHKNDRFLS